MDRYLIQGGNPLHGTVEISGAKNAAVAIIPAALMVNGVVVLENLPRISDVDKLLTILEHLGAKVRHVDKNTAEIDCRNVCFQDSPFDLMRKIRASYYLIGAMLGRFGTATSASVPSTSTLRGWKHWVRLLLWKTALFTPMHLRVASLAARYVWIWFPLALP